MGSFDVNILIDPGASHFFVNPKAILRLGLTVSSLQCSLLVSGPKCDPPVIEMICYACLIMVENKCFVTNLVVIELTDFDVILGMDWFLANYATFGCRSKVVEFRG